MIRSLLLTISLLLTGACLAQAGTGEKTFDTRLQGTISKYPGKKVYVHHRLDDEVKTDSTNVKGGNFARSQCATELWLFC